MKLSTIIVFLTTLQLAANSYPQDLNVDINNGNLSDVFEIIENQTDYTIFYKDKHVDSEQLVNVKVKDGNIENVLESALEGSDLSYSIIENIIVLLPKGIKQERTITGKIVDQNNIELLGVTVVEKGTTNGTITNLDGEYSVTVKDTSAILVYSFIGYVTQEIKVGNKTAIDVQMVEDVKNIDEVVVVGYGTQKKANLTGAVASVDFQDMQSKPAANTSTLLQGQMTGVQVSSFSNQPGQDNPEIRIRGVGTLNAGAEPLVIVDGVESTLADIPASDIESVSVLKDAASASIYGVRAANGVIVVTTKRGRNAKPTVNFKQSFSWQKALVEPDLLDSWDMAKITNLDYTEQGQDPLYTDEQIQYMRDGSQPDYWGNTNWFDEMFQTAPMNTSYLSVSGSQNNVRYMVSGEYMNQQGIMIETGLKRYNFRSNIDIDVTDKIKIGMNISGNRRDIEETLSDASATNSDNDLNYSIRRFGNPTVPVKYSNGDWAKVNGLYYEGSTVGGTRNVVEMAKKGENNTEKNNIIGKVFADIELMKNLHFKPNLSMVYNSSNGSKFSPTSKDYDATGEVISEDIHNSLMNNNLTTKRYQVENLLTYDYTANSHKINVLLGQSAQMYRLDYFKAYVEDFPNNTLMELNGGINNKDVEGYARELALNSFFGRFNYSFADKYLFEFNYRYDGTSRMGEDNRWGGFPSVSAGWIVSNEKFLESIDEISFLKFRGSWGQLGNQNIGGENFYPYVQYIQTGHNYLFDDYVAPGVAVTGLANPDIQWEKTTITDFGIDINLFNDRIQLVADWFNKTSTDILVQLPINPSMGVAEAPFQNVGEVKNTGWEVGLNLNQKIGPVSAFGGVNLSHVSNEVVEYGGLENISNNRITKEGIAANSYYAYIADGYYQTEEEIANAPTQFGNALRPGDVKYRDISGPDGVPDGVINADYDRAILGNPFPELQYSFFLGGSYKGFDLYAFFQGIKGIDRFYWYNTEVTGNMTSTALDYWTEDNRNAEMPRWGNKLNNTVYSSFWLKDASYLRLKNLEIGYTLPKYITQKIKIEKARVYLSGVNLWTKTEVKDYDPEKLTNDDRNRDYPHAKVYSVGININF